MISSPLAVLRGTDIYMIHVSNANTMFTNNAGKLTNLFCHHTEKTEAKIIKVPHMHGKGSTALYVIHIAVVLLDVRNHEY